MFKLHLNWKSAADFTRTILGAGTMLGAVALNSAQQQAIVGVVGSIVVLVLTFVKPSQSA
jgi:hypothetical protein